MAAIKIMGFRGAQPRVLPRMLPDAGAQAAINCRLDDGGLTPIHRPMLKELISSADHLTIYRHVGSWLSWATVVDAAPGPVDDERLYYTGDGAPKMLKAGTVYDLAVPRPTVALTATLGGAGSGDTVTRAYVYTWVTDFGEESEPNPASNLIDWKPGNTVTLSGFASAPAGRAITKQRIYRSQTGQSGTYLYFIAERSATNANFSDTVAVDAFAEPLPSADWNAPPDNLSGLTVMPNGMMAAFSGRKVYFCEPWHPHAWPEKYVLTVESDIVALGAIGTSLIILTTAKPYFAMGSTPDTMQMTKLEVNWPCLNKRAVVDLGFAIAFPTWDGLAIALADGSVQLVTNLLFNRDTWQRQSPATMVAAQLSGRYVGFYDTLTSDDEVLAGAMLIEAGQAPFLINSSAMASATYYDEEEGALYFLRKGTDQIWRFDDPEAARDYQYWRSKAFVLPQPDNFGALLVDSDTSLTPEEAAAAADALELLIAENEALIAAGSILGDLNAAPLNRVAFAGDILHPLVLSDEVLTVGVYADGVRVAEITTSGRPERLPGGFKARTWEIDVYGDVSVSNIVMGRTMADIVAAG
ncbi:hypothetical protein GCM10007913_11860 [Devosia yakushimensis]|uniref:Uncharacterized protein n=1 Tax=Devosia yakushimensis TaxID=470028 RepID=A0ABQ5UBK6_9HYPH|nr:hypothetical protein [Devosia yakushimensis]GLQ09254.1 hypothetical protein GCM10007913_11860 [Devosia yakushimensis]